MTLDEERIFEKIAYIQGQVLAIQSLLHEKSKEEIIANQWFIRGLKYSLQTSIEAMIDIAYHVSAKHIKAAPTDGREAIAILTKNGILADEEQELYSVMIGFRNRVVHGYQTISNERVYEISSADLDVFSTFIRQIRSFLKKSQ
ncbi:MAG: DUF86 domain-containing protein [Firmicutes bacterium]|nr:DUF86 domain-containing protein [Bacillota bacterium]